MKYMFLLLVERFFVMQFHIKKIKKSGCVKIQQENSSAYSSSITTPQFLPVSSQQQPCFSPIISDHSYCKESVDQQCPACCDKNNLIKSLTKELAAVNLENDKLKKKEDP